MRISTTNHAAHTAPKRPARPSAPAPHFGPGEGTDADFGKFQLNSARPRPRPKAPAVPVTPAPAENTLVRTGWAGPGPAPLNLPNGGTFTFDPTAPRAPLQFAPSAPGFTSAANFGPAPGAGWAAAANLVAQG